MIKRVFRSLLGERVSGVVDYLRFPDHCFGQTGPFNGQPCRLAIFESLIEQLKPIAILETGTYHGVTTASMSDVGLPVFTIEDNPRNYGYARARLWRRQNVTLLCQDSRTAIRSLLEEALRDCRRQAVFFYLDAHWKDDLPLAEELDIVFSLCPGAIVMIDDFQVPDDAGYGYDDYGPGKALTMDYIAPVIAEHGLQALFPVTPSADEGGMRRGCVVLVKDAIYGGTIGTLALLRVYRENVR